MKLALVADTFPPLRTSGAVQLFDLAKEISLHGHDLTVFIPLSKIKIRYEVRELDGFRVVYIRSPNFKNKNNTMRGLAELLLPFNIYFALQGTRFLSVKWDGIIWYSPTIFLSPFIHLIKSKSRCNTYLILRDLFPDWLVDMGLLKKGIIYKFLKLVEMYQYSIADTIGIQTQGNFTYFKNFNKLVLEKKIQVLHNWLGPMGSDLSSIRLSNTCLRGKKIFIYAGNMGIAQGAIIFVELAKIMLKRNDVGFLFIGRGSELINLKKFASNELLTNVLFFDEVPTQELVSLYKECSVGLLSLDERHLSHNIPGKFLSYITVGLPVLAVVNKNNDMINLIDHNCVGRVTADRSLVKLEILANNLLDEIEQKKEELSYRCIKLAKENFSPKKAADQILKTFTH
jgi:glycosyltransferase involved in cell wall biosynthesis